MVPTPKTNKFPTKPSPGSPRVTAIVRTGIMASIHFTGRAGGAMAVCSQHPIPDRLD
jgi:hypothetical protein